MDIRGPISTEMFFSIKTTPLLDDYEVKQMLGEGSFGQVKLMVHRKTKMERAVKIIKKHKVRPEEKEQMMMEVSILKTLDHPNIIKIFDMYEDQHFLYLVIEYPRLTRYCSGGELFDRIQKITAFTERQAAKYIKQLLSAVAYLHAKSIVHRDLKAENLLFENDTDEANLKLIDFGVSCGILKGRKLKETLGTPYYMAPEVLLQNYDEKCDVWSCGIILYILLCGYPPFNGEEDEEILESVKKGEFAFYGTRLLNRRRVGVDFGRSQKPHPADAHPQPQKQNLRSEGAGGPLAHRQPHRDETEQKHHRQSQLFPGSLDSPQSQTRFRHAIITFMANMLVSKGEQKELLTAFQALDLDGNGVLTVDELIQGYKKIYPNMHADEIEKTVNELVHKIDVNGSGQIDFTEFLVASMSQNLLLNGNKIARAFEMFDTDGDGFIDRKELKAAMGGISLTDVEWDRLIEQYDTDLDGKVRAHSPDLHA